MHHHIKMQASVWKVTVIQSKNSNAAAQKDNKTQNPPLFAQLILRLNLIGIKALHKFKTQREWQLKTKI